MLETLTKELHYKNSTHILPSHSDQPPKKRFRKAESRSMLAYLEGNWDLEV